jgi:hypothetical protein
MMLVIGAALAEFSGGNDGIPARPTSSGCATFLA